MDAYSIPQIDCALYVVLCYGIIYYQSYVTTCKLGVFWSEQCLVCWDTLFADGTVLLTGTVVLTCTVLICTDLYCTVLYCIDLYPCSVPYFTDLCWPVWHLRDCISYGYDVYSLCLLQMVLGVISFSGINCNVFLDSVALSDVWFTPLSYDKIGLDCVPV